MHSPLKYLLTPSVLPAQKTFTASGALDKAYRGRYSSPSPAHVSLNGASDEDATAVGENDAA
jgi:hypothetical protein